MNSKYQIINQTDGFRVIFTCFASDCEIIIKTKDSIVAKSIANIAYFEAKRIEEKYSRYSQNNIIYQINSGKKTLLDNETKAMFEFAKTAYDLSQGMFDITSGILRKIWNFNQKSNPPTKKQIKEILPYIGFNKINLTTSSIELPKNMEIDFGGFGKEYAVDRVFSLINANYTVAFMVNFGGDLRVNQTPEVGKYWLIDIAKTTRNKLSAFFKLEIGAIATSGDEYRYIYYNNKKFSHILNPKTGKPVAAAPSSVSVGANSCLDAGLLSTLAILQGSNAKKFLEQQQVKFFIQ